MIIVCRACTKENKIADLAESYVCEYCGASFSLSTSKVIERDAPKMDDPLGEFR